MSHSIDWSVTSQTNSTKTELADLVNRGTATKNTGKTTGTVQFREGDYNNPVVSNLDIKSIDSVKLYFTGYVKSASSLRSPLFRVRKNGQTNWIDQNLTGTSTTYNKTLTGGFSKASAYNVDIEMDTDASLVSTGYTVSNVFLRITYTLKSYTLTVTSNAGGTVSGGGTYESGKAVTIKATPNSGYRFLRWSDGNTNATRTVTVTANATYTAVFEQIEQPPKFTSVKITPNPVIAGEAFILTVGVE